MDDHVIVTKEKEELPAVVSLEERKLRILRSYYINVKFLCYAGEILSHKNAVNYKMGTVNF